MARDLIDFIPQHRARLQHSVEQLGSDRTTDSREISDVSRAGRLREPATDVSRSGRLSPRDDVASSPRSPVLVSRLLSSSSSAMPSPLLAKSMDSQGAGPTSWSAASLAAAFEAVKSSTPHEIQGIIGGVNGGRMRRADADFRPAVPANMQHRYHPSTSDWGNPSYASSDIISDYGPSGAENDRLEGELCQCCEDLQAQRLEGQAECNALAQRNMELKATLTARLKRLEDLERQSADEEAAGEERLAGLASRLAEQRAQAETLQKLLRKAKGESDAAEAARLVAQQHEQDASRLRSELHEEQAVLSALIGQLSLATHVEVPAVVTRADERDDAELERELGNREAERLEAELEATRRELEDQRVRSERVERLAISLEDEVRQLRSHRGPPSGSADAGLPGSLQGAQPQQLYCTSPQVSTVSTGLSGSSGQLVGEEVLRLQAENRRLQERYAEAEASASEREGWLLGEIGDFEATLRQ